MEAYRGSLGDSSKGSVGVARKGFFKGSVGDTIRARTGFYDTEAFYERVCRVGCSWGLHNFCLTGIY